MNRSIDIAKALTFYTEDEKWLEKLGIGTALVLISTVLAPVLIGLVGFMILMGYCVRLLQNVRDDYSRPLPEWDRWGEDLASGFKLFVAMFIYVLPAFVLIIPAVIGIFIVSEGSDSAQIVGLPFIIGAYCLIFIYAIIFGLMTPGITIAYARDESIGSALRFSAIWDWTRARIGSVLIVAAVNIGVGLVIGFVAPLLGVLLCVIGLIVTIPLATLVQSLISYHLYGQLANEAPYRVDYTTPGSAPTPPTQPAWFENPQAENPATPSSPASETRESDPWLSAAPNDTTPGDTLPSELGDIPNRPDDRPNLPQNPT